jgi:hypothetical protein
VAHRLARGGAVHRVAHARLLGGVVRPPRRLPEQAADDVGEGEPGALERRAVGLDDAPLGVSTPTKAASVSSTRRSWRSLAATRRAASARSVTSSTTSDRPTTVPPASCTGERCTIQSRSAPGASARPPRNS